jgi:PBSX family phage terminase large subunit
MNSLAPLTMNQRAFIDRSFTSWLNVAEGGKRGGKNVLATLVFCIMLEDHPNRLHLVGGVSNSTAKLNILDCDGYGLLNYFEGRYREGKYKERDCVYVQTRTGEKIILVSGGGKDGDEKLIKGNTYGMAYITEANECHLKYLREAFDRTISSQNRKVFHDLNPKDPKHWYYTDILDFHENAQRENTNYGFNYGHFTIADNMSMTNAKIKTELTTYDKKSVWYKRDILGKRTSAEGLIYPMFNEENEYDDEDRPPELEALSLRYSTVDYGVENPCVFLDIFDDGDTIWVDREYHYDGRKENKQKTNDEYADDFDSFFEARPPLSCVVIDPSAASFKEQLRRRGYPIRDGKNDVDEGIKKTATLFYRKKIRVHKRCKFFIAETAGYIWDEKARERGEEIPLKKSDHALDAIRYYVNTIVPKYRITG